MRADVLDRRPAREWALLGFLVLCSITAHIALAEGANQIQPRQREQLVWMEMAISEVAPAPEPPPPPPEPEPEKPPEVVDYVPPPPVPAPPPPPTAKPVPKAIQGLSNDSFLAGTGAGTARAGTTTAIAATEERMGLDDAAEPVQYAMVTEAPKLRYKPTLTVPDEVIAAGLEGTVELLLTIDAEGRVIDLEVVSSLSAAADKACVAAMRSSRWKPGGRDGSVAVVRGVPYACRFQKTPQ